VWCPVRVDRALTNLDGVVGTVVDFERSEVRIEYDGDVLNVDQLTRQLALSGYPASKQWTPPASVSGLPEAPATSPDR